MNTQRNTETLIVGGTATPVGGNYPDSLAASEVGIFTEQGVRMTEALAATESHFYVAAKDANSVIYMSPVYAKADIKSASRLVYSAATAQLDFIGYDGTSGSINVINDNLYKLNIQVQELLRSNTDGRKAKFGVYQSDSSATQAEIAIGLAGSLVDNFDREAEQFITFKAICNTAASATNDMTNAVTATNGSKVISVATALTYNGTSGTLAVGDFIRFAPSTAATDLTTDDATTRAYEVYRVESISGLNVTLDRKFAGTSELYEDADDACQVITAATGAAADWGVALTGAALDFVTGKENYEVARWESQMIDFGTTTDNRGNTAADPGTGVINQMKQLEWFVRGNDGEYGRESFSTTHSPVQVVSDSVTGGGYDMIRLTFDSTHQVGFQNNVSPAVLTIISPATTPDYALDATGDDITDVLETLAGTGIVAAAGLSLG
jgi:hypothetical protein